MSLVPLAPDVCPECGNALMPMTFATAALFRHGGYGATRREQFDYCVACSWSLHRSTAEVSPNDGSRSTP